MPGEEISTTSGALQQAGTAIATEDDVESEESYVENAINQNASSITLSVYDQKNVR